MTKPRRAARHEPPAWLYYAVPLLLLALFAGKPFHIDDPTFIHMGELLPFTLIGGEAAGPLNFLGLHYPSLSAYESTHPVLIPFCLKWLGLFAEGAEPRFWVYHLGMLVFPAAALWYARTFARTRDMPLHWGWWLVLSPVCFVNATNLMTDVAMFAFWLGAVLMTLAHVQSGRRVYLVHAAIALFLALMTAYQSIALLPLLLAFHLMRGTLNRDAWLSLVAPCAAMALYLSVVYVTSGYFPFLSSSVELNIKSEVVSGLTFDDFRHKTNAALVNIGLGLMLATPLLAFTRRASMLLRDAIGAVALTGLLSLLGRTELADYSPGQGFWLWLLTFSGAFWLVFFIAKLCEAFAIRSKRPTRAAFLALVAFWFGGVLAYNILFMPYGAVRYMLPALAPAILILFDRTRYPHLRAFQWPFLILLTLLSLLLARIDFEQAAADYRIYQRLAQRDDLGQLWYSDDAGLTRYLPNLDARYLTLDTTEVPAGDTLLYTRGLFPDELWPTLSLRNTHTFSPFAGLSLFNTPARAGFYRSRDGLLPVWFADSVREARIYEVDFFRYYRNRIELVDIAHPDYFGYRDFQFPNGATLGGLYLHPDAHVRFPLDGRASTFSGAVVTDPASWDRDGNGVRIQIGVDDGQALWDAVIDGKNNSSDRTPRTFAVDLPKGAANLWIRIMAEADYRYDGTAFLDLRLE